MASGRVAFRVKHDKDEDGNICRTTLIETFADVEKDEDGKLWAKSREEETIVWERPEVMAAPGSEEYMEPLEVEVVDKKDFKVLDSKVVDLGKKGSNGETGEGQTN